MAGVLTIEEYVHSEEARDDHEIRTHEEYIWEVQKSAAVSEALTEPVCECHHS
jgi:hypothetical protein